MGSSLTDMSASVHERNLSRSSYGTPSSSQMTVPGAGWRKLGRNKSGTAGRTGTAAPNRCFAPALSLWEDAGRMPPRRDGCRRLGTRGRAVTISEPRPDQRQEVRKYPFGPPERLELHPMYRWLREHEPRSRVRLAYGEDTWLVVRHDDARAVLADLRFSRAIALSRDVPRMSPQQHPANLLDMDPPEHSRVRRLLAKAFTSRRVEQLRPRAQQIADGLL